MLSTEIPGNLIEKRIENIRRICEYREVDHIPFCFDLVFNPWGFSVQEELTNRQKQLKLRLYNIEKALKEMPYDYIPGIFINIGCVGVDIAYGAQIHRSDNYNLTSLYHRSCPRKTGGGVFSAKA